MKKPVNIRPYSGGFVITCSDQLKKGDIAYTKENGRAMVGKILNMRTDKFVRLGVGDLMHNCCACEKVVLSDLYVNNPIRQNLFFTGEVRLHELLVTEKDLMKLIIKNKWSVFMDFDEFGQCSKVDCYNGTLFIEIK